MNVKCTVVKPTYIAIDFDCSKIGDDNYIEQKRREIREVASTILKCYYDEVIIHDSELPVLIE